MSSNELSPSSTVAFRAFPFAPSSILADLYAAKGSIEGSAFLFREFDAGSVGFWEEFS